jgi:hypothetical protein
MYLLMQVENLANYLLIGMLQNAAVAEGATVSTEYIRTLKSSVTAQPHC